MILHFNMDDINKRISVIEEDDEVKFIISTMERTEIDFNLYNFKRYSLNDDYIYIINNLYSRVMVTRKVIGTNTDGNIGMIYGDEDIFVFDKRKADVFISDDNVILRLNLGSKECPDYETVGYTTLGYQIINTHTKIYLVKEYRC